MKLKPNKGRILVEPERGEIVAKGIVLPDKPFTRLGRGRVVAGGDVDLEEGDRIVWPEARGSEYKGLVILSVNDVLLRAGGGTEFERDAFLEEAEPFGSHLMIRPCENVAAEIELVTDAKELSNYVEILDVGPECKRFRPTMGRRERGREGATIWCPDAHEDLWCVDYERWEVWVGQEQIFPPMICEGEIPKPLADWMIVEMEMDRRERGMFKPDEAAETSWRTAGKLIAMGGRGSCQAKIGDRVVLAGYDSRIPENYTIEISGKTYACLSREKLVGVLNG